MQLLNVFNVVLHEYKMYALFNTKQTNIIMILHYIPVDHKGECDAYREWLVSIRVAVSKGRRTT